MITSWGMDAVSFAETSYTVAAARSIRSKFRQLGWKAVLGPPARDKFATRSGAASFRGLSKGVGLASSCYEVVPGFVPQEVWAGGRIHLGCVNQGSIPIHIVTVYLLPNSPPGSQRFETNNAVLNWVVQIVQGLVGPVVIQGDYNAPLERWSSMRELLSVGWVRTCTR